MKTSRPVRFVGVAAGLALLSGCPLLTGSERVDPAALLVPAEDYVYDLMPHDYGDSWVQYVVTVSLTIVNRTAFPLVVERCATDDGPAPHAVLVRDEASRAPVAFASFECVKGPSLVIAAEAAVTVERTFQTYVLPDVPEFGVSPHGVLRAQVFTSRGTLESDAFMVASPTVYTLGDDVRRSRRP